MLRSVTFSVIFSLHHKINVIIEVHLIPCIYCGLYSLKHLRVSREFTSIVFFVFIFNPTIISHQMLTSANLSQLFTVLLRPRPQTAADRSDWWWTRARGRLAASWSAGARAGQPGRTGPAPTTPPGPSSSGCS